MERSGLLDITVTRKKHRLFFRIPRDARELGITDHMLIYADAKGKAHILVKKGAKSG